jgi:hypothetical protein
MALPGPLKHNRQFETGAENAKDKNQPGRGQALPDHSRWRQTQPVSPSSHFDEKVDEAETPTAFAVDAA